MVVEAVVEGVIVTIVVVVTEAAISGNNGKF